jgi:proteasome lid subunit RPN8/RPN11
MFIHTQPDGSSQLSEEDRDLESADIDYTCIQYAEVTESALSGDLGGINCWKVVDGGESFDRVDVTLR